jgi:hypothetical protein
MSRSRRDSRSPVGRRLHERIEYDHYSRHSRRRRSFTSCSPPIASNRLNCPEAEPTQSARTARRSLESIRYQPGYSEPSTHPDPGDSTCAVTRESESERAERLTAMVANASEANDERRRRLATRLAEEKAEFEREEQLRAKSGGSSSFINNQQRRVFGGMDGGLGDYMRRGKVGLVVEQD